MCAYIHEFLRYCGMVTLYVYGASMILSYPILGFPIDRKLPERKRRSWEFSHSFRNTFLNRPIGYAFRIVFMTPKRKEKMKRKNSRWYRAEDSDYFEFDFQKETNLFQKAYSYIAISNLIFMIMVIFPFVYACSETG